jgi:apolipoprotein N-acyltransferase
VATFGLSALQASFSGLFGVLLAGVARRGAAKKHPLLLPLTAGVMYPIFEWAQTFTWAGVPWARLASGQVESMAVLKSVSLFGPYFLAALIVTVNFYLSELLLSDSVAKMKICAAAVCLSFGVNVGLGAIMLACERDGGREIKVAAVQPNISSRDPWGFDTADTMMEILREYSLDAAENGAELIVWPETVFPMNFFEGSEVWDFTVELAEECGATIVVGAFSEGVTGDRNSLFYVSPEGETNETVYSKRRLVPFGEFVPWRGLFEAVMPQLVDLLILSGDLEQSEVSGVADTDAGKLGGIICFDSIYEGLTLESVRDGAELLILSTNDSWFTGSKAVEIHASQARLRATETGRYLVRSASTGISMIITPNGEILDSKPELEGGYVMASVRLRDSRTLYSVIGNSFVYISLALMILMIGSSIYEYKMNKTSKFEKNNNKF